MKTVTPLGKILGFLVAGLILFGAAKYFIHPAVKQLANISAIILPDAPQDAQGKTVKPFPLPSIVPASINGPAFVGEEMEWNAQIGLNYANGGPKTTKGSIMEANGINLTLKRQDDCNQMVANLIKFGNDYKNNPSNAAGTSFIVVMGDGSAPFLYSLNKEL